MPRDPLLNAHESKLMAYESAGLTDLADRQRAAIAKLEKAAKAAAKEEVAPKPAKAGITITDTKSTTITGSSFADAYTASVAKKPTAKAKKSAKKG